MEVNIKTLKEWKLNEDYSIRWQSKLDENLYLEQHKKYLVQDFSILPWKSNLSEKRKSQMQSLKERISDKFWVRLALIHKEQMIGWSYGWQDSIHQGDFYIAGSMVIPEHRRKGLYTEMLTRMISVVKNEGFSSIRSSHICTNNAVIIAKLKTGFVINGFEQDEIMGTLIKMIFHNDEFRQRATLFRAGKVNESDVYDSLTSL